MQTYNCKDEKTIQNTDCWSWEAYYTGTIGVITKRSDVSEEIQRLQLLSAANTHHILTICKVLWNWWLSLVVLC